MKYLKYLLIGLIQGLTEPLPISSSAHMIFINHYFGFEPIDLTIEIIINFASTLAIMIFFFKDIKEIIYDTFNKRYSYIVKLFIASIPVVVLGFLFKDYIDNNYLSFFSSSIMLIFTGIFLLFSIILLNKNTNTNTEINYSSAITIGIFQGIALIPGLSRSGLTLTAGITTNNTIKSTLRFSFFLYLIASIGAFILELFDLDLTNINYLGLAIGFVSAFITTSFSIRWFYNKLNKKLLIVFMFYSFLVGTINLLSHFL